MKQLRTHTCLTKAGMFSEIFNGLFCCCVTQINGNSISDSNEIMILVSNISIWRN